MEKKEYNYLAVFLGNTADVRTDIENFSVGEHTAWAESRNVSIATFISTYTAEELTEILSESYEKEDNRNFFIMKVEESSIFFSNTMIKDRLFDVFDFFDNPAKDYDLTSMSDDEKLELVDKILDKGSDITPYDQKLLELLTQ